MNRDWRTSARGDTENLVVTNSDWITFPHQYKGIFIQVPTHNKKEIWKNHYHQGLQQPWPQGPPNLPDLEDVDIHNSGRGGNFFKIPFCGGLGPVWKCLMEMGRWSDQHLKLHSEEATTKPVLNRSPSPTWRAPEEGVWRHRPLLWHSPLCNGMYHAIAFHLLPFVGGS